MPGRPRTPTNILELRGAMKVNPGRYADRANEPKPLGDIGSPPRDMSAGERKAWRDLVAASPPGVLCQFDRIAIETAARALAASREGDMAAAREIRQWVSRFGMTPADRSRVSAPKADEKKDRFQR